MMKYFVGIVFLVCGYMVWDGYKHPEDRTRANAEYAAKRKAEAESQLNEQLKAVPDLQDCKGYYVDNMRVVRCPNSKTTTNYQSGKASFVHVTVVDG